MNQGREKVISNVIMLAIAVSLIVVSCTPKMSGLTQAGKEDQIKVTHLDEENPIGFADLQKAFAERNQGYDLAFHHQVSNLSSSPENRVLFVQDGGGTISFNHGLESKFSIGDIIMLTSDASVKMDSLTSLLAFTVPDKLPTEVPAMIRPDWDPKITDIPGGCATETNAYRRILLTWMDKVGPYLFHSINAHRVRIMDSFTHYHPVEGGFDEFYLVQMALPEARLITSSHVERIENPNSLSKEEAGLLLQSHDLKVGDLIYMPRGTVHRGVGGVLAQVITVPGFIPGSEVGVDHHLKALNERLELVGKDRLPYNLIASKGAVVK